MISEQCLRAAIAANTGRKRVCSEEHKTKLSAKARLREKKVGPAAANWKGDAVGYTALHSWVSRAYGCAAECEHCGDENAAAYDWANVSGEYKRERSDWLRLCRSCHMRFDKRGFQAVRLYEFGGKRQGLAAWARELGIGFQTLYSRVCRYNMPLEKAFRKDLV